MGVKWETIPTTIQTALESSLRSNINDFEIHKLFIFLRGSELMGFKWVENMEMKQTIFEIIATHYRVTTVHDEEKISPFLYLLGITGVKWVELPDDLKNNVLIALEKECRKPLVVVDQVGDILCGLVFVFIYFPRCLKRFFSFRLGRMGLKWKELPENIRKSLEKNSDLVSARVIKGRQLMGYSMN
jgi:hypothetical protein